MAPAVIEIAAGSAAKEFKKESAAARLLGSGREYFFIKLHPQLTKIGSAGIAELAVFHPASMFTEI